MNLPLFNQLLRNQVALGQKLDQLTNTVQSIVKGAQNMALDLSKLLTAVQGETTQTAALVTLLNGIAAQLKTLSAELANEPAVQAQIDQMTATLTADQQKIVDAINANTPAAPAAPATPAA